VSVENRLAQISDLRRAGRMGEALEICRQSVASYPTWAPAHHALAQLLRKLDDLDGALIAARRCVELAPKIHAAWATLGVVLMERGELDEATACFRTALSLAPNDRPVQFNLAETLLLKGDFTGAWVYFEAGRLVGNAQPGPRWDRPSWDGSSPGDGKTILVYADAGFGDSIQFVRYVPLLRERGFRVSLLCQDELRSLLATVEGVSEVVPATGPLPAFDLDAPMMSLPRLMGTTPQTVPARVPYLSCDRTRAEYWRKRVQTLSGRRIGLAWAGRATHANDAHRSLSIEQLRPLWELENVSYVSLQKGRAADAARLEAEKRIIDWTAELADFSETAALIENLDMVISVDTSVAHLSGALGKKVWTLLPFAPDWRWMLKREDSPWYPTMRLFRQSRPQEWGKVIASVADCLRNL
jgi:hypothetical protein